jgi:hypothetical protein
MMPKNYNQILQYRRSIIILHIDDKYESLGKQLDGDMIQRSFMPNDDIIKCMRNYLKNKHSLMNKNILRQLDRKNKDLEEEDNLKSFLNEENQLEKPVENDVVVEETQVENETEETQVENENDVVVEKTIDETFSNNEIEDEKNIPETNSNENFYKDTEDNDTESENPSSSNNNSKKIHVKRSRKHKKKKCLVERVKF